MIENPEPGPVVAAITSDDAEVLYEADRHAGAFGRRLVICHVMREVHGVEEARDRIRESARSVLDRGARGLEIVIGAGAPAHEILRISRALRAELIVVGRPRHGRLAELVRGCTVDHVLRASHVPVIVARPSPRTHQIVVASDLVDPSYAIIAAARREADALDADVVALHTVEPSYGGVTFAESNGWPGALPPRYEALVHRASEHLALGLRRASLEAESHVVVGATKRTILDAAAGCGAELLIIGMHHDRHGLARLAARSVTWPIVRRAPCSVFVVPLQ